MRDVIFMVSIFFGFISLKFFSEWCENQITKKQQ